MKPFSDSELHAFVDGQLDAARALELQDWLRQHPEEARRVADDRLQRRRLRALFDPVLDEALPPPLQRAAGRPAGRPWRTLGWRVAAALALLCAGLAGGWALRGLQAAPADALARAEAEGLPRRAAVAYAVYTPEVRRPVEVDAAHQEQLVTWLSRRMGAPMKPPLLQAFGYSLEGGRLLPGADGPVAQFMYADESGSRLTLYVSRQSGEAAKSTAAAFRFAREGKVNVFYWVDGPFGYALSAEIDRAGLARVSGEVYRQLQGASPS